jgi:hypothetical protein
LAPGWRRIPRTRILTPTIPSRSRSSGSRRCSHGQRPGTARVHSRHCRRLEPSPPPAPAGRRRRRRRRRRRSPGRETDPAPVRRGWIGPPRRWRRPARGTQRTREARTRQTHTCAECTRMRDMRVCEALANAENAHARSAAPGVGPPRRGRRPAPGVGPPRRGRRPARGHHVLALLQRVVHVRQHEGHAVRVPHVAAGTSNDTELEKLKKRLQFVMYCIDCFVS